MYKTAIGVLPQSFIKFRNIDRCRRLYLLFFLNVHSQRTHRLGMSIFAVAASLDNFTIRKPAHIFHKMITHWVWIAGVNFSAASTLGKRPAGDLAVLGHGEDVCTKERLKEQDKAQWPVTWLFFKAKFTTDQFSLWLTCWMFIAALAEKDLWYS